MHRIDADAHVANQFSEGDPTVPRLPTRIDAAWLNAVQEELAQMVLAAGAALIKGVVQLPAVTAFLTRVQTWTARQTFSKGLVAETSTSGPGVSATANLDVAISASTAGLRYAIEATSSGAAAAVRMATSSTGEALYVERTAGTGDVLEVTGGTAKFTGVSGTSAPIHVAPQSLAPGSPVSGDLWAVPSTASFPAALFMHDGYANHMLLKVWQAASPPTAGRVAGDLYYDTTLNRLRCWDGSAWNSLW